MSAISPALIQRLRYALVKHPALESDRALRAVFTDARIAPWRDLVPENTLNRAARVNAVIAILCNQANAQGESALHLFLQVLAEQNDPADSLHHTLSELAQEIITDHQYPTIVTKVKTLPIHKRLLIVIASLILLGVLVIWNWPTPSPAPFQEAHFGILVADFVCGAARKATCSEGADLAQIAYEDLLRHIQRENLTGRVELRRISALRSEEQARSIGESSNAQLVIWGYIPDDQSAAQKTFVPSFVLLKDTQQLIQTDPILFGVRVSGPETFALSQQLAARATSVSNFVLSVIYLTAESPENYPQAVRLLTRAIDSTQEELNRLDKTDPRHTDFRYTLALFYTMRGRAYAALGDEDAAYEDYQTALENDPNAIRAYIGLGNYYYARGDFATARNNYETARDLDPTSYAVHYSLAIVAYMQQDYQETVRFLEDALAIAATQNRDTDAARLVLGVTYQHLGQFEAADQQFQIVLSNEEAFQDLREAARSYLELQPQTVTPTFDNATGTPACNSVSPTPSPTNTFLPPTGYPTLIPPTGPPPDILPTMTPIFVPATSAPPPPSSTPVDQPSNFVPPTVTPAAP